MSFLLRLECFWLLSSFLLALTFFSHFFLEHKFDFLPAQPSTHPMVITLICSSVGKMMGKDWTCFSFQLKLFALGPLFPKPTPFLFKRLEAERSSSTQVFFTFPVIFQIAVKICSKRVEVLFFFFSIFFTLACVNFALFLPSNSVLLSSVLSWILVFHAPYWTSRAIICYD